MHSLMKAGGLGAATLLAAAFLSGPGLADGMPSRGRIAAPAPACSFSGNVAVTSDYVFRGVSQTLNDPALQGGVEAACGRFYLGLWGSNVDFGDGETNVEIDLYAGFKTTTGPVSWDIGVIYYGYPGGASTADFVEIKVGASGSVWKGGTVGGTVFYSPEYTGETGPTWTFEGAFTQALPNVGMFTPTFGATLGTVTFSDDSDADYVYWNAGLTLGFLEKWSLDLRYWDTDVDGGCPVAGVGRICDERFVATVKYNF